MDISIRERKTNERCNCENKKCCEGAACLNLAGDTYIDSIGYVCNLCAQRYPLKYHVTKDKN